MLVKHSLPAVDPAVPAAKWPLSDEGRKRCRALALRLSEFDPATVVSSPEPKAADTARALSGDVTFDTRLREHDRTGVPWLGAEDLERSVREAFDRPEEVVFGQESIAAARDRFAAGVGSHLARARETLIVVAHGTVISAYTAQQAGIDGYALWGRLGLPSFVVLDGAQLVEVVEEV